MSRLLSNFPEGQAWASEGEGKGNAAVLGKRAYGQTGVKLSIIGLGGIVVKGAEQKHANEVVSRAIEKGVNYFDVAPTYGDAELKLGPALKPYRKKVFLACKTRQRKAQGVRLELKQSLERLRTDYLDLYQLHGLDKMKKDVDVAFAKGGAMEVLIEAKKAGVVRHLGFSAHSVEAALAAMDRYDFDSVLFPINFACYYAGNFGPQVIEKAKAKKAAVLAMKVMAREPWPAKDHPGRKEFAKCWYEPLSDRKEAELALRFALSEPVIAAIPPGEEKLFWMAVDAAMDFEPLSRMEKKKVQAWGVKIRPIFSYKEDER
ncbi:MAG: aldo/keto reductase [Phycisphaerae bacterium]|nr:aldo/keto reductase [Phycisphaerae bacterium]